MTLLALLAAAALPAAAQLDWSRDPLPQARALLAATPAPSTPAAAPVSPASAPAPREPDCPRVRERAGGLTLSQPAYPAADPLLHCRPEVIAAFKEIWRQARHGRVDYEAAFRVDLEGAGVSIVYADLTREPLRQTVTVARGRTMAIAHTHPDSAEPTPGPRDHESPVPNYIVSRRALFVTVPGTREHRLVRRDWDEPCR
ncbi:MAG: hypothetical protein SF051_12895 [Elusimicrobiota bacterium]|nr:hypothetical protein [Elusimicrobiota bacterium]